MGLFDDLEAFKNKLSHKQWVQKKRNEPWSPLELCRHVEEDQENYYYIFSHEFVLCNNCYQDLKNFLMNLE